MLTSRGDDCGHRGPVTSRSRRTSMQIRTHALLAALLLAACGGDGSGGGGTSEVVEIIKWTPSGDNQTGLAGTTLPLALRVKVTVNDQNAEGRTVTWSGPGVFGSPSSVTNVNGVALTTWTMPDRRGRVSDHVPRDLQGGCADDVAEDQWRRTGRRGVLVLRGAVPGAGGRPVRERGGQRDR